MSDKPAWLKPHGTPWSVASEKIVYDNPWITLTEYQAVAPTGRRRSTARSGVQEPGDRRRAAARRRHGDPGRPEPLLAANYSWELPEGGAPLARIRWTAPSASWPRRSACGPPTGAILRMELSNSVTDEICHGFLAMGLTPTETAPDETEDLAVVRVPFGEALDAAVVGHMPDSLTVALLLRVHHMAVKERTAGRSGPSRVRITRLASGLGSRPIGLERSQKGCSSGGKG
jgi:hypothetical protein